MSSGGQPVSKQLLAAVSAPAVVEHQNFSTTLLGVTRGLEALSVFCEHRYFENGHKMPWGRGPKHTNFQWCKGFCAPSFSKLYFLEKHCFYRQFFSSVANSWNKSLSTLFFLHAYWYAWLNHRRVSLNGHKWSLRTISTAHQFAAFQQLYSVLASSFLAFFEWTQSDSV